MLVFIQPKRRTNILPPQDPEQHLCLGCVLLRNCRGDDSEARVLWREICETQRATSTSFTVVKETIAFLRKLSQV